MYEKLVKDKFLITSEPDSCSDNLDNSLFWLLHIEVSSFTLATRSWKTWTLWLTNLDLNLDWKQNKSKNLSKGPIFSEKYWYYFHCPQNVLCSILRFVFWTFPPFKTAVQLESDQSTISKYIFQDSFRHIFWAMRKMHHTFWKKATFSIVTSDPDSSLANFNNSSFCCVQVEDNSFTLASRSWFAFLSS